MSNTNTNPTNETTSTPIQVVAPTNKWEEHNQFQRQMIQEMASRIVQGDKVDPAEFEILVDPNLDNSLFRDFALKNGICTKSQFADILRRAKIKEELGTIPVSATHLVDIVVKRDKIECQYDGMLTRSVTPHMICPATGEKLFYDAESMKDETVRTYCEFHFPKTLNFLDFERQLRILNDDLKLGFSRDAISDALTQWYETSKKARLYELYGHIGAYPLLPKEIQDAEKVWHDLAAKVFDTSHDSEEFVIAVLKKFIWQTKRKIRNAPGTVLPVTNHLMPVLLGPQGVGKSTFVNKLITPLRELTLEVDFRMIEDDRNIDIWSSFILFLDEMGYASKANVDTIKHCITANHLARRPMRTNTKVMVQQNATFIGCSNKTVAQLIKDPTGIRRFVGLQFSSRPCWQTMNSIDYSLLWLSVDPNAADPMLPFMGFLTVKQEDEREKGRVEEWLSVFDPNAPSSRGDYGITFAQISKGNRVQASDLFQLYSEWEGVMFPGSYGRLSINEWGHEMKRLMDNSPGKVPFEKGTRSSRGQTYIYSGPYEVAVRTRL
ncbi:VapE domain-containing protein [Microvirga sp. VF16]|uniref:VapE domain-containing protein n=1 Tax=Microvirga sp. VF16 TaxID=2807101 RepID=UPI00193EA7EB|nr:VapE domain-containing protein [Microvirga sp. VF16]QRM27901.1 hypothetical protein JO965_16765 [Microvirga sp. VF16]